MTTTEWQVSDSTSEIRRITNEECVRASEPYDFEWTDCETFYEEGEWLGSVFAAVDDDAWMNQLGLDCDDPDSGSEPGCSISDREPRPTFWALLPLIYVLVRRRSAEQ